MAEQIFQERSSSWRWQTLASSPPLPGKEAGRSFAASSPNSARRAGSRSRQGYGPPHTPRAATLARAPSSASELLMPGRGVAYSLPVMGMPSATLTPRSSGATKLTGTPVFLDVTRSTAAAQHPRPTATCGLVRAPGSQDHHPRRRPRRRRHPRRWPHRTRLPLRDGQPHRRYGGRYIELADTALNPFAGVVHGIQLRAKGAPPRDHQHPRRRLPQQRPPRSPRGGGVMAHRGPQLSSPHG